MDTTTALKTVCRPTSFIPWCRRTRRAYRDCALSLMTRRMWDKLSRSRNVTPDTYESCQQLRMSIKENDRSLCCQVCPIVKKEDVKNSLNVWWSEKSSTKLLCKIDTKKGHGRDTRPVVPSRIIQTLSGTPLYLLLLLSK